MTLRYYYYYSSNLRAHAVCDYGTLPIMRQDLSSYPFASFKQEIKKYEMSIVNSDIP